MFYPHSPSRLSVIVPKKVSKLATTRNHFKRLVYDSVWEITNDKNRDCVVMFKPLPLQKSFAAQQQIISELKFLIPNS
jgi:ribonuclease P protein component